MGQSTTIFNNLVSKINKLTSQLQISQIKVNTSIEMRKYADILKDKYVPNIKQNFAKMISDCY